jgi:alkylated DNA repair dioxygenase AlkB
MFTSKQLLCEEIKFIELFSDVVLKNGDFLAKGTKLNIQINPGEYDVETAWQKVLALDTYDVEEKLSLDFEKHPKWVSGKHPNLNYRGRAINRTKLWCQEKTDSIFIYNYTGFQYAVAQATFNIHKIAELTCLVEKMKKKCDANHWIVTKYEDNEDSIGLHSDKTKNWEKGSSFQVVKFGCQRRFQVVLNDSEETVIFDMFLPSGTSITVDIYANSVTKHAVPKEDKKCGISGSIVSRLIKTVMTIPEFEKKVEISRDNKKKRKIAAEKRAEKKLKSQ